MHLYRIYTRQTEPGDSQYFGSYCIYADNELSARVLFHRRLKHAVIQDIYRIGEESLLLLEA